MQDEPVATRERDAATLWGEMDAHLFNEGTHVRLYEKLGAQLCRQQGVDGTHFAVWAPNANYVSVIGDFNDWDKSAHRLEPTGASGIWQGFIAGVGRGARYKYHIGSAIGSYRVDKADPFGLRHQLPPETGSVVWDLDYRWGDDAWMAERGERNALDAPMSIYEVHLGSWRRGPDGELLGYREIGAQLADHVERLGFTHVELMPVMEHPFGGSWGYQVTGYFAATARYGTPQDLMALIDELHQRGIGVILDWVPAHFPADEHGLGYFDGTHLYEHADPRQGIHPDWDSLIFNFGRKEVRSFLMSSALFWLERYHADGLRVDGVASLLYLDYSRKDGEWIPNDYGGRENLEAISFLREMNAAIYERFPDVQTIAEESTDWPMVSRPVYVGGLGFGFKWDMGWMHDSLRYLRRNPIHRRFHHNELTFRSLYADHENFIMPLSHDEVVHGKGSLLGKMPGDEWQRFANLRLLLSYMWAMPGKKLLFMGAEIGQWDEWSHDGSVDWALGEQPLHRGVQLLIEDLNRLLAREPALHELDRSRAGFEWIDANDAEQSALLFQRKARSAGPALVCAFNFTPVPRHGYRIGVDDEGFYRELLNSDAHEYGGSGQGNLGGAWSAPVPWHGRRCSVQVTLPPLGAVWLRREPI